MAIEVDAPIDPVDLFSDLIQDRALEPDVKAPQTGLDDSITQIYTQAHKHRDKLINFFIWYTIIMSLFVVSMIAVQSKTRMLPGYETVELIPQNALYLLIVGMFGQFIGLLTIVTKKVWTYETFLRRYDMPSNSNMENRIDK